MSHFISLFFFNDTATTEIYTLSLHDALPIFAPARNIHPIPEGLSMTEASFAEPVAIGVQACRRGNVSGGDMVLILGCRSGEDTAEIQSRPYIVCRLLL